MSANTSTDDSTASKPTEREYDRDEQGRRSWDRYAQMIRVCYNSALIRKSIEADTDTGEFEATYDPSEIDGELIFDTEKAEVPVTVVRNSSPDSEMQQVTFYFEFEYYNYDRPRLGGDAPDSL
jgi:N-acyl-D-aspartate/D-glutamate deacylase